MPATTRSKTFPQAPEVLWEVVGNVYHLPRWWPRVARVEGVREDGFTQVMRTDKGRTVRADYRMVELREPAVLAFEQELEGTPFERLMSESSTRVELEPDGGGTKVTITIDQKLKGMSRFGGGRMFKVAQRKQADGALEGLAELQA